jgi:hypothetical protein
MNNLDTCNGNSEQGILNANQFRALLNEDFDGYWRRYVHNEKFTLTNLLTDVVNYDNTNAFITRILDQGIYDTRLLGVTGVRER